MNKVDELTNRLENWKFADARVIADNTSLNYKQREVIYGLDALLGNVGWFEGVMGNFIGSVVSLLCQELSEKYLDILDKETE